VKKEHDSFEARVELANQKINEAREQAKAARDRRAARDEEYRRFLASTPEYNPGSRKSMTIIKKFVEQ